MNRLIYRLVTVVFLSVGLTSCATTGVYWIPPSSPPTQSEDLAFFSETAIQLPTSTATPTTSFSPTPVDPTPERNPEKTFEPSLPGTLGTTAAMTDSLATSLSILPTSTATPEIYVVNTAPILYYAQAADTLPVVAVRFGVSSSEITSPEPIPETEFINPGQLLIIPRKLTNTTSATQLIPDSEVVYSPSAVDFDAVEYAQQAGGYLKTFREWHKSTRMQSGAEIIMRVALENSINPRLLLALLEFRSHWVYGKPESQEQDDYPMGYEQPIAKGLYNQLVWAGNQLSIGYYAYREGRLTEIHFSDGVSARLAPDINAGTAALQYFFAQFLESRKWLDALDPGIGFPALYTAMFGDPWERARTVEPLFPPGITQPPLILPFTRNWTWSYTGGPHGAWEREGAYAALDFAPGSIRAGCATSQAWTVAPAAGLVVRTGPGLVVIDLDGDGHEQTGWVLIILHVAAEDRIPLGSWVAVGDPIGHPSCEGGFATGTHIHIARKYNGEWVPADGPLPFNLGGWIAHYGGSPYKGTLTRNGVTVIANVNSNAPSFITRTDDDP
jgi:LysM repeat protein